MSPFSASSCERTTTQSPSVMAALIIESPRTWEQEVLSLADQLLWQRERVLDLLLGDDRATGCDLPDPGARAPPPGKGSRKRAASGPGSSSSRSHGACRTGPRPAVAGSGSTSMVRGRPEYQVQVALALQHLQVMGHRRGALQAQRLADLADRRRIAAAPHDVTDVLQHLFLAPAQCALRSGTLSYQAALRARHAPAVRSCPPEAPAAAPPLTVIRIPPVIVRCIEA